MPNMNDNTHLRREVLTALGNIWIESLANHQIALHYCNPKEDPRALLREARNIQAKKLPSDERFREIHALLESNPSETDFLSALIKILEFHIDSLRPPLL
jgi:hypothetical protein